MRRSAHSEHGELHSVPLHIDAMLLATEVCTPGRKWLKLEEACDIAGVTLINAHNAEADAIATAQLMSKLFTVIENDHADRIKVEPSMRQQPFLQQTRCSLSHSLYSPGSRMPQLTRRMRW